MLGVRSVVTRLQSPPVLRNVPLGHKRYLSFSFTGAKKLSDIMEVEKLRDKSKTEIQDLWHVFHENQENSAGFSLTQQQGSNILERASKCKFFIQPVFRDGGYFMLVSEFQKPYFLLTYLEEYQTNPGEAAPKVTGSLFDDFHGKDLTLVRCDFDSKQIKEAPLAMESVLHNYLNDYETIETFNQRPDAFSFEDFVAKAKEKWPQV